jgi:hypothetical protein
MQWVDGGPADSTVAAVDAHGNKLSEEQKPMIQFEHSALNVEQLTDESIIFLPRILLPFSVSEKNRAGIFVAGTCRVSLRGNRAGR